MVEGKFRLKLRGKARVFVDTSHFKHIIKEIKVALDSYIFLSGDGDFATLYKKLIEAKKQAIVIYAPGHIGREIWEIQRGLFKVNIQNMGL